MGLGFRMGGAKSVTTILIRVLGVRGLWFHKARQRDSVTTVFSAWA